jgi:hypothetical protein
MGEECRGHAERPRVGPPADADGPRVGHAGVRSWEGPGPLQAMWGQLLGTTPPRARREGRAHLPAREKPTSPGASSCPHRPDPHSGSCHLQTSPPPSQFRDLPPSPRSLCRKADAGPLERDGSCGAGPATRGSRGAGGGAAAGVLPLPHWAGGGQGAESPQSPPPHWTEPREGAARRRGGRGSRAQVPLPLLRSTAGDLGGHSSCLAQVPRTQTQLMWPTPGAQRDPLPPRRDPLDIHTAYPCAEEAASSHRHHHSFFCPGSLEGVGWMQVQR